MGRILAVLILAACYSPHPQAGAPCTTSSECPLGQDCVDHACGGSSGGADAAVDTGPDSPDAPPGVPRSCQDVLTQHPTATSGDYMVDPDGPGGGPQITVSCDMTTDGGGWTIVFLASMRNLSAPSIPYTIDAPQLLANAQRALIAFRDSTGATMPSVASFPIPTQWQTSTPFDYQAVDINLMVSIDGAAPIASRLRFGEENFPNGCGTNWDPASAYLGRICLEGTNGPYYVGFASNNGDWCQTSMQGYNTKPCDGQRVFSIAVR